MSNPLDNFLSSYSREAREIALCLRKLVLDVFPQAFEKIDTKAGIIAYSINKTECGLVCAIAPHMKYVNLLFSRGASLSDEAKMLVGTGKLARHVKIKAEEETENPALKLLLKEAFFPKSK